MKRRALAKAFLFGVVCAPAFAADPLPDLQETPMFAEQVKSAALPPVAKRVPQPPWVVSEETEDSDALQLVAAYRKKIGIKMLVKPQTLENFRLRAFSGNALMTAYARVVTAVPTPATSPKEFAPTIQGGLQWPKWGMFVESKGDRGEKCDLVSSWKLLDYVKEWEQATTDVDRRKAWDKILQTNADEVFSIGTVKDETWSGLRCAMCPRKATTPGIPADISGSISPTRSGSRSSAGQRPTISRKPLFA